MKPDSKIICDLQRKASDDVLAALMRTLALAPAHHLAIATAAGASVIGAASRFVVPDPPAEPTLDQIMLAALIVVRMTTAPARAVADALDDLEILRAAGRLAEEDHQPEPLPHPERGSR